MSSQALFNSPLAASPRQATSMAVPAHSKREHDMRNLVYLIASFTQLLSDGLAGPVSAKQKEFLSHVLDCAGDLRQLLNAPAPAAMQSHTVRAQSGNSAQSACA